MIALALAALLAVPGSDAEVRAAVGRIVAETDARARAALVDEAVRLAGERPLAELVALVRRGPPPPAAPEVARDVGGEREELAKHGTVWTGYAFLSGGKRYRYAVDVPAGYDPKERVGLLLDPGHGTGARSDAKGKAEFLGMWRRHADAAGGRTMLVARTEIVERIGTGGLDGERPEDEVAAVFGDFLRDVSTRFAVDLDRVYATGISQTGFWAWYLGRERADALAGIAPMSAVTWQVDGALANLLSLRAHVVQGAQDAVVAVGQARTTSAELARLGGDVRYVEVAAGAHDYATWGRQPEGLRWLLERPRERHPKLVSKSLGTLASPWAHWLRVDALAKEGDGRAGTKDLAGIDGEIEGQRVRLHASGVRAATLALSSERIDLAQPVIVEWNGKVVHEGRLEPGARALFETLASKGDWLGAAEATLALKAP